MRTYQSKPWSHDYKSNRYRTSRIPNYGTVDITTLPPTLGRPLTKPYDQGQTMLCAAFAAAKNGELMHGFPCSPEWQADKISRLQGFPAITQGSNPNSAMDSQLFDLQGGHLPQVNWDPSQLATLDNTAMDYSSRDYTKPDQGKDVFDSIRIGLFMHYDQNTKLGAGVQIFIPWYESFETEHITEISGALLGYHSVTFDDYTMLTNPTSNDADTMRFVQSYGTALSLTGYQTMTRAVVNQVFSMLGTSYKQPDELTIEQSQQAKAQTPTGAIWRTLMNIWYSLILSFYHA